MFTQTDVFSTRGDSTTIAVGESRELAQLANENREWARFSAL